MDRHRSRARRPVFHPSSPSSPRRAGPVLLPLLALLGASVALSGCLSPFAEPTAPAAGLEDTPIRGDAWAGSPFTLSLDVPEGVPVRWDFGDGTTDEGNPVNHTYATPGLYVVTAYAQSASLSRLLPVHWRSEATADLRDGMLARADARQATFPIPLISDSERVSASFRVRAADASLTGTTASLALVGPNGGVLAAGRAVLASGASQNLTVTIPRALIPANASALRAMLEVEDGSATFAGTLEVRTHDPR